MNTISISPSQPEDAEGIAAVQYNTWLATYPNEDAGVSLSAIKERISSFQSAERVAKWRTIISAVEENLIVAKVGKEVIGFSGAREGKETNEITTLYVLPEYHGRGVAQSLMDAALTCLGDNRDVVVEVASYNLRAINFYQKYDFIRTGEIGQSGVIPTIRLRLKAKQT